MKRKQYPSLERVIPVSLLEQIGFDLICNDYPYGNEVRTSLLEVHVNGNLSSREELSQYLYSLGVDVIHYNWYLLPYANRRIGSNIVCTRAVVGQERIDKEWIRSGYASEEAFFKSSGMSDMTEVVKEELANGKD